MHDREWRKRETCDLNGGSVVDWQRVNADSAGARLLAARFSCASQWSETDPSILSCPGIRVNKPGRRHVDELQRNQRDAEVGKELKRAVVFGGQPLAESGKSRLMASSAPQRCNTGNAVFMRPVL
jgi:hypothetical protein